MPAKGQALPVPIEKATEMLQGRRAAFDGAATRLGREEKTVRVLPGPAFVQPLYRWMSPQSRCSCPLGWSVSMPIWRTGAADQLRSIGMTLLGIVLALIPPALWVAWTETGLLAVVAVGVACAAALVVLADSQPQVVEDRQHYDDSKTRKTLSDASIVEIHRIFPLTYHHSLVEKARFRQTMDKIRRMLG